MSINLSQNAFESASVWVNKMFAFAVKCMTSTLSWDAQREDGIYVHSTFYSISMLFMTPREMWKDKRQIK